MERSLFMRFGEMTVPTVENLQDQEIASDETTEGTETAADDEFASELASDQAEMETSHDVAQRSIDIASNLDAIQASANEVVRDTGAFTPSAAMMTSATMESICRSLGIEYKPPVTMEAFAGTWSKKAATTSTMEAIVDTLKKAGNAVLEAIRRAMEAAKKFLSGIFANRALLEMRVQSLLRKVSKMDNGMTPKKSEISGSFVPRLSFHGRSDYSAVMQIMQSSESINGLYGLGVSFMKDIRDKKINENLHGEFASFLRDSFGGAVAHVKADGGEIDGYGAVIGSMSLAVDEEKFTLFLIPNGDAKELNETSTPKVFEMKAALTKALSVIQNLRKAEAAYNTVGDLLKGIMRALETEYNRLRSAMGSEEHSARLELNKQAKAAQSILSKMIARLPGLVFMSVKYVCDWASAGIRAYPVASK